MLQSLARHWPEYLMEAAELGLFMVSAALFTILLEHPASPVRAAIGEPFRRHFLAGLAMGATAIAIVYSPWGKQSGAHFNPAVTLTFFRLGKIEAWDAGFYVAAQFVGAVAGMMLVSLAFSRAVAHPTVNYVVTLPGADGPRIAFLAELAISFFLMLAILTLTNTRNLGRFTGVVAGCLVATYITFEAPLSGMSMNPARSFGSAVEARLWTALWVYFTAPPLGMLAAAELYARYRGLAAVKCAKLHHQNDRRCIFRCGYRPPGAPAP